MIKYLGHSSFFQWKILCSSAMSIDSLSKCTCSSLKLHIELYGKEGSTESSFAYRWERSENALLVSGMDRDTRVGSVNLMDLAVRLYSVLIFVPEAFLLWTVHLRVCTVVEGIAEILCTVKKYKTIVKCMVKKTTTTKTAYIWFPELFRFYLLSLKLQLKFNR